MRQLEIETVNLVTWDDHNDTCGLKSYIEQCYEKTLCGNDDHYFSDDIIPVFKRELTTIDELNVESCFSEDEGEYIADYQLETLLIDMCNKGWIKEGKYIVDSSDWGI